MEEMAGMCNLPITSRLRYHCATRAPPLKALPQKLLSVNIIRMRDRKVKIGRINGTRGGFLDYGNKA